MSRFNLVELLKDFPEAQRLMNVKDKQNVPSAVQLLMLIKDKTENIQEGLNYLFSPDAFLF